MSKHLQHIREKLFEAGLKATQQRIVVYDALLNTMSIHPTAENIYEVVKPENPSLSLGTVYKTLDVFVASGLASRVSSAEGHMRYDANMDQHNHIYCTNTKEIIDYRDEELDQLIQEFFKNKNIQNLKINQIHVQINGNKLDPTQEVNISK